MSCLLAQYRLHTCHSLFRVFLLVITVRFYDASFIIFVFYTDCSVFHSLSDLGRRNFYFIFQTSKFNLKVLCLLLVG